MGAPRELRSADDALRRYVRLRAAVSSPRGIRTRAIEGVLYAPKCPACGRFKAHTEVWSERYGWRVVCSACRAHWPALEAWVPPGVIDARVRPSRTRQGDQCVSSTGRRRRASSDTLADRLAEIATLERILFGRPRDLTADRWRFTVSAWFYYVEGGLSAQQVADLGGARHGRTAWSLKRVQRAIALARRTVESRMERDGLAFAA